MKVVVAIDSFKGSLSSMDAGLAARDGILRAVPDARVKVCPLADGGEGTVLALTQGMGGQFHRVWVTGPLGTPVLAEYGILHNGTTAVIEMAAAAGITLVPPEKLNPMEATTFGVGELIGDAIHRGCRNFIVGIGGSATNDGGVGMLQALGFSFLDSQGHEIVRGARGLKDLSAIHTENVLPQLAQCTFRIACDVKNPLCKTHGCSAVFAPQKGADAQMIAHMDAWLSDYAKLAMTCCGQDYSNDPGAGAAGGLGFAFLAFTNAVLESGIQIVMEETGIEQEICQADVVLTGEGRMDGQTAMGKAPVGVAALAKKYGKPVLAVAGSVTRDAKACNKKGIDAFFPIIRGVCTLEEAMEPENARANMTDATEQIFRLLSQRF